MLGAPVQLSYPELKGFNFQGGLNPSPEYAAMLMGLSIYHASQIAEIVRSGIQAVSIGQKEAAAALGLRGGFVMRLVSNWLVARLAEAYVETIRNIPVLLQIFFWYFAVIRTLPGVRQSINLFDVFILNNRGIYLPDPTPLFGFHPFLVAVFVACVAIYFRLRQVRAVPDRTGEQRPVLLPSITILVLVPGLVWLVLVT